MVPISYAKKRQAQSPASFLNTTAFWFWDRTPDDRDTCRNSGRHGEPDAACDTVDTPPVEVKSDGDATAARPGGRAMYVVLVTLPLFQSPVPPVCRTAESQAYSNALVDTYSRYAQARASYDNEPSCNNFSRTLRR